MADVMESFWEALKGPGGAENAIGDYTSPTAFTAAPLPTEDWLIQRFTLYIRDSKMRYQKYGGRAALGSPLLLPFGEAVMNADFLRLGGRLQIMGNTLAVTWDLEYWVRGHEGGAFIVTLEDDFRGLDEHRFLIAGQKERRGESWRRSTYG